MKTILEYLYKDVLEHPARIALEDLNNQITYQDLWDQVRKIGHFVVGLGMKNEPVGVIAGRDIFTPVLLWGVLCGRNYYVPLDPEQPDEKLKKIIDNSGMKVILGTGKELQSVYQLEFQGNYYDLEGILNVVTDSSCSEGLTEGNLNDPMYMIYTSGSTGVPKGVLKTQGAMVDFVEAFTETFSFDEHEVIGNQTPFFFDASAKDLYLMLKLGATLEILPTEMFSFPVRLMEHMNERKVTMISWVPSALSIVTQLNTFLEVKPDTLKKVFFVGEVFPMKQFRKWREALPDLQYVNLYGSSEIAGVSCYYQVKPEDRFADTDVLPIGIPLPNCKVCLIKEGKLVEEKNCCGEIYISSAALAKEYFGDEEKTCASFVQMAPDSAEVMRYFKTGDMAHYDESGCLVFESRRDFQIKHMGHRIELGEIETMALSVPEVEKCGCIYNEKKSRIVLFCELKEGVHITGREIQSMLRARLSSYMLPGKVIVLDRIPMNANGKTDRLALKKLEERK